MLVCCSFHIDTQHDFRSSKWALLVGLLCSTGLPNNANQLSCARGRLIQHRWVLPSGKSQGLPEVPHGKTPLIGIPFLQRPPYKHCFFWTVGTLDMGKSSCWVAGESFFGVTGRHKPPRTFSTVQLRMRLLSGMALALVRWPGGYALVANGSRNRGMHACSGTLRPQRSTLVISESLYSLCY